MLKPVAEDMAPFRPGQPRNNQRPKQEHTCAEDPVQRQPIFSPDAISSEWRPLSQEKINIMSLDVYIAHRRIEKEYWRMYWATKNEKTLSVVEKMERSLRIGPEMPNECRYDCDWLSGKTAKKLARQMNRRPLSKREILSRLCAPPRPVECFCKCPREDVLNHANEATSIRPPTYRSKEYHEPMSTRPPTYRSEEYSEFMSTRPPTYQPRDYPTTPSLPQQSAKKIAVRYRRSIPKTAEKQPAGNLGAAEISQPTKKVPAQYHRPFPRSAEKQNDIVQSTNISPAQSNQPNKNPTEDQVNDDLNVRRPSSEAKALPARYRRCPARQGVPANRSMLSHISDPPPRYGESDGQ